MTKATQYKNTSIGPIPIDWEVKKLGEEYNITMGQSPNSQFYNSEGIGLPLIQGNADIVNGESIIRFYTSQITKTCEKDELIFTVRAPVGEMGIAAYVSCLGRGVCSINHSNSDSLNYIKFYLENYRDNWGKLSQGSTFEAISGKELKQFSFPLPPLPEQQKIAEILSTWDKAIQETDTIIKKLEDRNKGLVFLLLTGKKRVKGFEDEWNNYKLEHFFEEYSSKPNSKIDLPVFTSSKNGLMSQSDYYSGGRISSRENVDYNVIPSGFITYRSRSDDGLFTFNKNTTGYDGLISGYYPVFKVINGNDNFFLNYLNFFKNRLTKYSTGTSQLVLSFKALKSAKFNLPSLEEQNAIAEILNTANQEVKQYQQKLETLKLQKKGLMQQLLTGKVRTA